MRLRLDHPVLLAAASFVATVGILAAGRADAQVMQIGDDGSLRTRTGVGIVDWDVDITPSSLSANWDASIPAAPPVPQLYADTVARVSAAQGIAPALLEALIWQESRWRAAAVSRVGARGLTQLMPGTARMLHVDPRDPVANIEGGARYLRQQLDRFGGNVEHALAAYNAGPDRVAAARGVPRIAETRAYVAAILTRLSNLTEKRP